MQYSIDSYSPADLEEIDNLRTMYEWAHEMGVTPEVTAREQDAEAQGGE